MDSTLVITVTGKVGKYENTTGQKMRVGLVARNTRTALLLATTVLHKLPLHVLFISIKSRRMPTVRYIKTTQNPTSDVQVTLNDIPAY